MGNKKERKANPVMQMRKAEKTRNLKKQKQQRVSQQESVIKQKNFQDVLYEMDKLNDLEIESVKRGYFNDKTIREKRHKLKENVQQMIAYYDKTDKAKAKELRKLLDNYDNKRPIQEFKQEKSVEIMDAEKRNHNAKELIKRMLPYIPLPPPKKSEIPETAESLEKKTKVSQMLTSNLPPIPWLPINLKPAGPPPLPPHEDSHDLPDHLKNLSFQSAIAHMINTNINQPQKVPKTTVTPAISEDLDTNKNYTPDSTLVANAVLKDLQAEVTKLVPVSIKVKKTAADTTNEKMTDSTNEKATDSTNEKATDILEDFFSEINDLT